MQPPLEAISFTLRKFQTKFQTLNDNIQLGIQEPCEMGDV